MKKIALTGGPAGGKSTALRHLEANFGDKLATTPEVATILLGGGFPTPTEEHPWTPQWQKSFQASIATIQIALEQITEQRAEQHNKRFIVCDRGLADGGAYLPGGLEELSEIVGQSTAQILGRYSLVIHLPTSATQTIGYQKHTNEHRMEQADEAIELETKTLAAWRDHPNRQIINIEDYTNRNQEITRIILEHASEY